MLFIKPGLGEKKLKSTGIWTDIGRVIKKHPPGNGECNAVWVEKDEDVGVRFP